jgi:hypothetical protein
MTTSWIWVNGERRKATNASPANSKNRRRARRRVENKSRKNNR